MASVITVVAVAVAAYAAWKYRAVIKTKISSWKGSK
jgi:hypothetical protein